MLTLFARWKNKDAKVHARISGPKYGDQKNDLFWKSITEDLCVEGYVML